MSISHAVQFYNDDVFLIDAVAAFITAESKDSATTIVVATDKHCEELSIALQATNSEWKDNVVYFDAIELLSAFMVDGWPNQRRFISTVGDIVERAALRGPVRIFGEMVAVLWAEGKTRAAIRLEELWNELATHTPFRYCVVIRCRAFQIKGLTSHFFRYATPIRRYIPPCSPLSSCGVQDGHGRWAVMVGGRSGVRGLV